MGGFENESERARNERVIIVDDDNAVVGSAPRHEMRTKRLPHRATFILVFDSDGRILVQKRTDTKDVYPGYHDLAAGGVVTDGESYEESAFREAAEELGIRGVPLEYQFDFYYQDPGNRCFGRVYSCVCEGPFELQPEEVVSVQFAEISAVLDGHIAPLTPDTVAALRQYLELASRGRPTSQ
jgi:8-oxo-dGTP pyrophosphatase MutT (NUDIX family)